MAISLVSYWSKEEASGLRYDNVGANHMSISNEAGRRLSDVCEYGVNTQTHQEWNNQYRHSYLYIDDISQAGLEPAGSFSAWTWFYNDVPFNDDFLMGKYGVWSIRVQFGYIIFETTGNDDITHRLDFPISGVLSKHFIGVSYDYTTKNKVLFLDGSVVATSTALHTQGLNDNDEEFTFGGQSLGGRNFDGWLDESGIADGVLSETDWDFIYNNGDGRCFSEFGVLVERLHSKCEVILMGSGRPDQYRGIVHERFRVDGASEGTRTSPIVPDPVPGDGYLGTSSDRYRGIAPEHHRLDEEIE